MNEQTAVRELSPQDFLLLGINDLAFVKAGRLEDKDCFLVFSADGTQMAALADRDVAFAAVRQNGMEPLSVH
ncbi:DUF1150 family protein [Pelagibius litoralis]|uniref:DUF1150 family protein n=1 Tax=Pelagibius litoralis TaxID=374515 RepID=A0A967C7S5_9PROT|nr:DUF1150 family protein [Pelagibius litoralis]NIA67957.1 DUF1150 family protein [Pelagibius litoralis]